MTPQGSDGSFWRIRLIVRFSGGLKRTLPLVKIPLYVTLFQTEYRRYDGVCPRGTAAR